jgi:uncharacterized protein (TIGR02996 family)
MNHESAFLAAIRDQPADDFRRLVYAEYLDGQGDPRGELIRVQCELAKMTCDKCNMTGTFIADNGKHYVKCSTCWPLREREIELFHFHWNEWAKPFDALRRINPLPFTVRFVRGFPEVSLTISAFLGERCEWHVHTGNSRSGNFSKCLYCHDTGYRNGLAGPLFAACPDIMAVRLTDREPDFVDWWNADRPHPNSSTLHPESELPFVLWKNLDITGRDRCKQADSPAHAHAAMSAACMKLGLEWAELEHERKAVTA